MQIVTIHLAFFSPLIHAKTFLDVVKVALLSCELFFNHMKSLPYLLFNKLFFFSQLQVVLDVATKVKHLILLSGTPSLSRLLKSSFFQHH